jgi:hypothetical protein
MKSVVFLYVVLRNLVDRYKHFRETACLHPQGVSVKMEGGVSLEILVPMHQTTWHHFPKDRDFDEVCV